MRRQTLFGRIIRLTSLDGKAYPLMTERNFVILRRACTQHAVSDEIRSKSREVKRGQFLFLKRWYRLRLTCSQSSLILLPKRERDEYESEWHITKWMTGRQWSDQFSCSHLSPRASLLRHGETTGDEP